MRSTVKLTGRRTVPVNSVEVKLIDDRPQRVRVTVRHEYHFSKFPRDSMIKLRLFENKVSETLVLCDRADLDGDLERPLTNRFSRPSCQLRIVQKSRPNRGLLLGSTPKWTIDSSDDGSKDRENQGILKLAVAEIDPRCWNLQFPDSDYPTVYLNSKIPNAKRWARTDPVFVGFVLPIVIHQIFDHIFQTEEYDEVRWMLHWVEWAQDSGASSAPSFSATAQDKESWIKGVIDRFSLKNKILGQLVDTLERE